MKNLFFILLATVLFTGCSSDDNDDNGENLIKPSAVFPNGMPTSAAGMTMTYKDGLLTKIKTTDTSVIFDYVNTKSTSQHVKMTISDDDDPEDVTYLDLLIGDNGFVKSCVQTYKGDNSSDTWDFNYNSDGNLIYMKRSEGDNEVTTIKYENGNITEVSMVSEDDNDNSYKSRISYTSEAVASAINNKASIMLFDETFGIDMDEMRYAYWAGLLGKATKHLPVKSVNDRYTETYEWTLNSNGYPQKMVSTGNGWNDEYLFAW